MLNLLSSAKKENRLLALYTNEYDKFSVGYINCLTEDKVIILNVGVHGEFDGYSGVFVSDIHRIESNSMYLKKIQKISNVNIDTVYSLNISGDLFIGLLDEAIKRNSVVAVCIGDDENEIRGYIKRNTNGIVSILQITEYGEIDGETSFFADDITKIVIDDVECAQIDKLFKLSSN